MSQSGPPVTDKDAQSPSLRRFLLRWIVVGGLALVLCYTVLLEFYLDRGIELLARNSLEQVASEYAGLYAVDADAPLPAEAKIAAYRLIEDVPEAIRQLFPPAEYRHGELKAAERFDKRGRALPALGGILPACEQTPCEVLFFYSHRLNEHDWLYLLQGVAVSEDQDAAYDLIETRAIALGAFFAAALTVLAVVLINRVGRPVEQLARWADTLDAGTLGSPPGFRFRELNAVAAKLQHAFRRLTEGLAEEKRFLRHASHELRTPLSVISGNLEILEKIDGLLPRNDTKAEALSRLSAAVTDMRQLSETLLWLHRPSKRLLEPQTVDLHALVLKLVEENRYLLVGKAVTVEVTGEAASRVIAPRTPCRIVIANLVRNAFQYTHAGRIELHIGAGEITIQNSNAPDVDNQVTDTAEDYGFGLGLQLVERICARLGWAFAWTPSAAGRCATVRFRD